MVSELRRAGWADWGSEPTCITAATIRPKRIDQAWLSPEMQARLVEVQLSWSEGLETHAWQQGLFRGGPADQFQQWVQGDPGPAEGEECFMDVEFWALFVGVGEAWEAARLRGDVDGMWQALETPCCNATVSAARVSSGLLPPPGWRPRSRGGIRVRVKPSAVPIRWPPSRREGCSSGLALLADRSAQHSSGSSSRPWRPTGGGPPGAARAEVPGRRRQAST